ncbi:prolyl oligopeptidase family serine peptidase [Algoriphagus sediminis]|uniref:Prolyl oligopeptidase family serine peptidase n=1 Tax=Algoriphagus sediminis TaxID=3057113 RepID=A0ABT7Y9S2_9BACT|nr:prolyl oligopeptidase family serine peptidase [Algoriphagus sediminis]MDN3202949.1 prolyl oligopeptidase family serine peptidase [Algoriphagus sediminis]
MKSVFKIIALTCFIISLNSAQAQNSYTIVVEGFDWGPAVNKVILSLDQTTTEANAGDFTVNATRKLETADQPIQPAQGEREVLSAYVSDEKGNRVNEGNNITLVLAVGPRQSIASPFQYVRGRGNLWVDYQLSISNGDRTWNQLAGKVMPLIDQFDLTGKFTSDGISLTYASFTPEKRDGKFPLIIWLHGGGEGGTDPTVPLLGNRAANYASEEIQQYFDGAYVLVPQTPTRWMDSGEGTTRGERDDIYFKALKDLFDDFIGKNPDIDTNRIYVGGCSNGGYMSLKLLVEYPEYFAAGYISALAYRAQNLTDTQVQDIKDIPMWFIHSKDDSTTVANNTVIPVYEKLKAAGAANTHLTLYDHVVDITNVYGGKNYRYPGHWSWIYSHANKSQTDYDGSPVKVNDVPVTVMQWMSLQSK